MKSLVTGSNGNLGSKIVENLLLNITPENIAVSVRDINSEKALLYKAKGIDVRVADFEKIETLETAFSGIDRLFIISTAGDFETIMRHHTNALEAAKTVGVNQIVYPSVTRADETDYFLATMHNAREQALINSGIDYVILRNNWYVENELRTIQGCIAGAPWITSAGEGKVGWVYRPDLAEAAANVLISDEHHNKIYELSGENLTQSQFVTILSEVLNKEITLMNVDDNAYGEFLKNSSMPEAYLPILIMSKKGIRDGVLEAKTSDLEALLGHPATTVKEALIKLLNIEK